MIIRLVLRTRKGTKARATLGEEPPRTPVRGVLKEFFKAVKDGVIGFLKDCWNHTEAIAILVLSSLGLNALLGELPFYMTFPMWIEAAMVIPVISVLGISALLWSANRRAARRLA